MRGARRGRSEAAGVVARGDRPAVLLRIGLEVDDDIIDRDPESYRAAQPDWRPTLPAVTPGSFEMADLLTAAESSDPG